jgi:hypothetical protein
MNQTVAKYFSINIYLDEYSNYVRAKYIQRTSIKRKK